MKWRQAMIEDLRLSILRILAEAPGYELGAGVLIAALEGFGHQVSRDTLGIELAWLAEQGLLTLSNVAGILPIALLTSRGADAAAGRAVVPGIRRPAPGE